MGAEQLKQDLEKRVGLCESLAVEKQGLTARLEEAEKKLLGLQASSAEGVRVREETISQLTLSV